MRSRDLSIDVTAATRIDEPVAIDATLHLPDSVAADSRLELLFCLHGGGYRRSYWHPPFGSGDSYSFARYFTDRGKAVLAPDLLGMGESSKPQPESKLSSAKIAAASAQLLTQAGAALTDGSWAQAASLSVTGVGHSIGGMQMIMQAAVHGGMDRVAVLGWTNQPVELAGADVADLTSDLTSGGYLPPPRQLLRNLFYLPDVPTQLIEADVVLATPTPACLGRDALTPGIVHDAAAAITVPVFVAYGVVDTSADPYREPAYFKGSSDLTLNIVEGSAHCHNFATTRRRHWQRLDRWIDSLSR